MTTTVLLADDHAVLRDGLAALCAQSEDIRVIGTAANGRDAIEVAQRLRPDIVVMDISMPELDGVEATRHILAKCPATRVLILSMYLSAEHLHRCLQAGARGYVLKDSAADEVIDAIRALRAGKRYLSYRITEAMIEDYVGGAMKVSPLESLSLRERDVLQLVVDGHTNAAIAQKLSLSPKTVEAHRARILKKLNVRDTVDLVKFAMRHGIIS